MTTPERTHAPPPHVDTHETAHPGEGVYLRVALVLAAITGVEVVLSYIEVGGSQLLTNGSLLVLSAIKFAMVAAYFMHLKFDNPVLRRLFLAGLITAISVYLAYLITLGTFI